MSITTVIKGSFWVSISSVIVRLSGFIVIAFLAKVLGPADLGIYNLVQNTIQTGDNLSRIGADAAIHCNGAKYETIGTKAIGRLFGVGACLTIVTGLVLALLLWIFRSNAATDLLGQSTIEPWLGLTAFLIILSVLGNPPWFYMVALQAFRQYSLRTSVIVVVSAVSSVVLAWYLGLKGAIWSLFFGALVHFILGWWLTLPILKEKGIVLRFDHFISETRSILSFGLPFFASNFLSSFVGLPLLGYVSRVGGVEQLGYLRVAQSLSQFVSFLPGVVAPVIISSLSASFSNNFNDYQKTKSLHLRSLWLFILIVIIVISGSLDYLIPAVFGQSYSDAILLSHLTVWITGVITLSSMFSQYIISKGQTKTIGIIQVLGLVINVLCAFLLIPIYSSIGFLSSQAIAVIFTTVIYMKLILTDMTEQDIKRVLFLVGLSIIIALGNFCLFFVPTLEHLRIFILSIFLLIVFVMGGIVVFSKNERILISEHFYKISRNIF